MIEYPTSLPDWDLPSYDTLSTHEAAHAEVRDDLFDDDDNNSGSSSLNVTISTMDTTWSDPIWVPARPSGLGGLLGRLFPYIAAVLAPNEMGDGTSHNRVYHYPTAENIAAIVASGQINPSLLASNPRDAR
ncbi:MAG: hypothetical protein ACK56I_37565, partial [bacterium]